MRILLTGATGYIGKRILPLLVQNGHEVICCVRDRNRFYAPKSIQEHIEIIEVDFLKDETLQRIPQDIDAAYYLIHSMSSSTDYQQLELKSAINFRERLSHTNAKQVIYLSGIINEDTLSPHLESRKAVEDELSKGIYAMTTFRAGIIIGSGSASFEIIRDLVEKLPIMITPKWLNTRSQPIGISDVIQYLYGSLLKKETFNQNYDIGGPDILTYKEMLLGFAKERKLKRWIITVPVMTPRLSSYWLYFVTSTSFKLASALVDSMKVEVICRPSNINQILGINPISYNEALQKAFARIEQNQIISSWKDSLISGRFKHGLSDYIRVPTHGCFTDKRKVTITDEEATLNRIWSIGGNKGWYYANWLWQIRGFIDKLIGGVGLRRGRTDPNKLSAGDAVDFWRVLLADRPEKRLLLFAEMRIPGDAWLEFKIENGTMTQTATFRPRGLAGRLYWYSVWPFHGFVFNGMLNNIAQSR
ncbi:MAG: SDR family oxidoreductase [Cyclobacteriaceae bacterium]